MTPRLLLYGRHRLFPVAGKHLGQIQSQHRRLVATALSSSSSATRPTICFNTSTTATNQNRAAAIYCLFSDMSLRRPPLKEDGVDSDTSRKWRSHAISIDFGNYQDDEYSDINAITANTVTTYPSPSSWDEEESELAGRVQDLQREEDERRKRWLEKAKPPVRYPIIDERGRAYGRGGRKTASARVWIQPGFGNVMINRKDFIEYFGRASDRELILEPLAATETLGRFDVTATVEGGGLRGQAGAIRHGLARALNHYNPEVYRPPLKRLGYLTRDPRRVERKKIGHLKARKKPQWVKR